MDTIDKRINFYLSKKNDGNQSELARHCGVTPQAVQKWIAGKTEPKGKNLSLVAQFLGISAVELKFGSGNNAAYKEPSNVTNSDIGLRKIPLINYIQAGLMSEVVDIYEVGDAQEYLSTTKKVSNNTFALEIRGNSMSPLFNEGDRIIIDPAVAPTPGKYVVAKNGHEEATFKKYQLRGINENGDEIFELVPINPDYPSLRSDKEKLIIIGTAVEVHKII